MNRQAMGMPVCPLCERTISKSQALCNLAIKTDKGLVHKSCAQFPVFATTIGRKDYNIQ